MRRCIKPNPGGAPGQWDSAMALEQLRAGGVLEAVRIACAGACAENARTSQTQPESARACSRILPFGSDPRAGGVLEAVRGRTPGLQL